MNANDKIILDWILNEPQGATHLLGLLKNGKGTKEDFKNMILRIIASKEMGKK
jgi:hypothetical protein